MVNALAANLALISMLEAVAGSLLELGPYWLNGSLGLGVGWVAGQHPEPVLWPVAARVNELGNYRMIGLLGQ